MALNKHKSAYTGNEFSYGLVAIITGTLLIVLVYTFRIGLIAYGLGTLLILISGESRKTKAYCIFIPAIIIGILYLIQINQD